MLSVIMSDFSRVILFPRDDAYQGRLNVLHSLLVQEQGSYNFMDFFYLNEELLNFYESIKPDYTLCVFTESSAIQKVKEVRDRMESVFQFVFTPGDIGTVKTDPRSYLTLSQQLQKQPEEILFIDDRVANLQAAQKVGIKTLQYFSNKQLFEDLAPLGIKKK